MPRSPRTPVLRALGAALAVSLVVPSSAAHAQGWMNRVKAAAKDAATEAAARKAAEAARRGTESGIEAAAGAVVGGIAGKDSAAATAKPATASGAASAAPDAPAASAAPATVWTNYDFVPGTRPLYVDDLSADAVGDFPKRLKWEKGNFEVAEVNGARWLRATTFGWFAIPLPEVLPERFTLELEMIAPGGWAQDIAFAPKSSGGATGNRVSVAPDGGGVVVNGEPTRTTLAKSYGDRPFMVRVMADGQHVKVYMGETRVANVPQMELGRDRVIRIGVSADAKHPLLVRNVRVMAGGRALYDALKADGRVATQGILFATASDAVLPESAPTLKEIAAMLAAHPDLSLTIEGHTDDVGAAAANQALSEKRAAAVKRALVDGHRVDAARLTTQGFGASRPAVPNATAEGRAANRRVELVRR